MRSHVWPLAANVDAASQARRVLRACCLSWQVEPGEHAALIISELVGNAVRHGAPQGMELRLSADGRELRVEVFDAGSGTPAVRTAATEDESGRGLFLVQRLAQDFGVTKRPVGKTVWAVLQTRPAAGRRPA